MTDPQQPHEIIRHVDEYILDTEFYGKFEKFREVYNCKAESKEWRAHSVITFKEYASTFITEFLDCFTTYGESYNYCDSDNSGNCDSDSDDDETDSQSDDDGDD